MIELDDMIAHLEASAARARLGLTIPMGKFVATVAGEARAMLGTYQWDWEPLAASTVAEKTKLGFAPPDNPLLRTGELRESIGFSVEFDVEQLIGVVGSTSPLAYWFEVGTSRMPPRPFLSGAMFKSQALAEFLFNNYAVSLLVPGSDFERLIGNDDQALFGLIPSTGVPG